MDWIDRIGRRVRLRDLHIFLAVAQAGTMGRAAAALSVSQPVISKSISGLEAALRVRLFDRTARGIALTVYGEAMMECSRSVFDDLQQRRRGRSSSSATRQAGTCTSAARNSAPWGWFRS